MSGELYRPSNGTEGDGFIAAWCVRCERDRDKNCDILGRTFVFDIDDAEYPREWVRGKTGPMCTAWIPLGDPVPPPRCRQTIDMFDEDPPP